MKPFISFVGLLTVATFCVQVSSSPVTTPPIVPDTEIDEFEDYFVASNSDQGETTQGTTELPNEPTKNFDDDGFTLDNFEKAVISSNPGTHDFFWNVEETTSVPSSSPTITTQQDEQFDEYSTNLADFEDSSSGGTLPVEGNTALDQEDEYTDFRVSHRPYHSNAPQTLSSTRNTSRQERPAAGSRPQTYESTRTNPSSDGSFYPAAYIPLISRPIPSFISHVSVPVNPKYDIVVQVANLKHAAAKRFDDMDKKYSKMIEDLNNFVNDWFRFFKEKTSENKKEIEAEKQNRTKRLRMVYNVANQKLEVAKKEREALATNFETHEQKLASLDSKLDQRFRDLEITSGQNFAKVSTELTNLFHMIKRLYDIHHGSMSTDF